MAVGLLKIASWRGAVIGLAAACPNWHLSAIAAAVSPLPDLLAVFDPLGYFCVMETLIAPLIEGLLYPSESDEPIEFLTWERPADISLPLGEVSGLVGLSQRMEVTECDPFLFWEPVTIWHPWYGPDERERTGRFEQLRDLLESRLSSIRYFEIGKTETTLLLTGLDDGQLCGIKTMAVRT